jgi:hypothetical protein
VVSHAVSEDGSLVFWHEEATSGAILGFVRDMTSEETIELPGGWGGASANGRIVFTGGKVCEVILSSSVPHEKMHLKCEPVLGENHKPLPNALLLAASEDGSIAYLRYGGRIEGADPLPTPQALPEEVPGQIRGAWRSEEVPKRIRGTGDLRGGVPRRTANGSRSCPTRGTGLRHGSEARARGTGERYRSEVRRGTVGVRVV